MLESFFRLNGTPSNVIAEAEFIGLIKSQDRISDIIYRPDRLSLPKNSRKVTRKVFENVSFKDTEIDGIEFHFCSFVDCLFLGATVKNCEFHRCTFIGCNPYDMTFQATYVDPRIFEGMLKPRRDANIGLKLFQALLANSIETHQPEFAARAEFHFRVWKRYQLVYEVRENIITKWHFTAKWLPNFLYQWLAGYGIRTRYSVGWTILMITGIILMNRFLWSDMKMYGPDGPVSSASWTQVIYFSLVTISTLGYGDYRPGSGLGMRIIAFEAFVGLVLLSVFASIIIKRVVR